MGEMIICDSNPKFKSVIASFYYEEAWLNKEVVEQIKTGIKNIEQQCINNVLAQHNEQTRLPIDLTEVKKVKDHIDALYYRLYYRGQCYGKVWLENRKGPDFRDKTEYRVRFEPIEPFKL